jgi:hypothetical protein
VENLFKEEILRVEDIISVLSVQYGTITKQKEVNSFNKFQQLLEEIASSNVDFPGGGKLTLNNVLFYLSGNRTMPFIDKPRVTVEFYDVTSNARRPTNNTCPLVAQKTH